MESINLNYFNIIFTESTVDCNGEATDCHLLYKYSQVERKNTSDGKVQNMKSAWIVHRNLGFQAADDSPNQSSLWQTLIDTTTLHRLDLLSSALHGLQAPACPARHCGAGLGSDLNRDTCAG